MTVIDRPSGAAELDAGGRPTVRLPLAQLLQVSVYWFGINAVWGGWSLFQQERVKDLVPGAETGLAMALLAVVAMLVPLLLQPTIGSISDYTMTRWGRRKPYIAIGATFDVVFLVCLGLSQTFLAVLVFLLLLQFSSNFAQGPFQGYVPDLVPEEQVGTASGLMGLMTTLGLIGGIVIVTLGYGPNRDFTIPLLIVGIVELATALGTVMWVREGRKAKPREGRTWRAIALETWGTDILRERSYVWLLASRFFILMAAATFANYYARYMTDSLGMTEDDKKLWVPVVGAILVLATALGTIPSARLSDRIGRKRVIYAGCAIGAIGMAILAAAPTIHVASVGVALVGFGAGNFLAVDWALMTDIIPKASSGRYMGMSNVATATNGPAATAVVGVIYWAVGQVADVGTGLRVAFVVAIAIYAVGVLCLRSVVEPRHERSPIAVVPAA